MSSQSPDNRKSSEEILKWIEKYQQTEEQEALDRLVIHYNNLVESIARKYSYGKTNFEDIVQVGMIGLLGAIRRFDTSLGRSFEAFAVPTVVGEIKRFLRDKTWDVHVPRRIKELGPKIKSAAEYLTTKLQYSPSIQEIAEYLEVEEEDVLEAMEMSKSYHALSMDHSIDADSEGGTVTLMDVVGKEDDGFERTNRRIVVSEAMETLEEREKEILKLTYYDQLSQKEAGEMLGISQMHVSRIQRKAIKKLQQVITADGVV
ncbi:RNA polymerase sigma factor SigB [Ureibacillus chungkukjangi]|uniref:RNA polymerase sigma-37 (RpsB/SigB) subunit n=1 Tax=Ureibacillus chungkukjangi TaxID=1202712 RepID=A0A318TCD4_9BACL|nr:RNA polymerase sigma factor SigB [Ureibacillus chungkukjangi]MCM3389745.1 RNA polymerase sigma factor SigB [Ureibacillus chungkukjangi]PYF02203.1 RNA polymerase sigma-37 (RpsB/SigB) subunit [Ureibacillus chungkukjangi]